MIRHSYRLYCKRWWIWLPIALVNFAPVFLVTLLPVNPIVKKGLTLFGAAVVGVVATAYAVRLYKSRKLLTDIQENFWPLLGVAFFSSVIALVVWKVVELPVLALIASPTELAIYSGEAVSGDAVDARVWVDAVHAFVFIFLMSPLSVATPLVILRKLTSITALRTSIACFAANWLIFLALSIAVTAAHAFIREPAWFLFLQVAFYVFFVTPIFTIVNVLLADGMVRAKLA